MYLVVELEEGVLSYSGFILILESLCLFYFFNQMEQVFSLDFKCFVLFCFFFRLCLSFLGFHGCKCYSLCFCHPSP